MPKSDLKIQHKRFIVMLLAVHESPREVRAAIKEEFRIDVSLQQLQHYDPDTVAGRSLTKELKTLFETTRKEFEAKEDIPLSKKVVRLKKLSKYVEQMEAAGNVVKAAEFLEQIAKEQGGMFTNRKEITGAEGKPIEIHSKTLDDWKKDAGERTTQAAAVLEMFEDDAPGN